MKKLVLAILACLAFACGAPADSGTNTRDAGQGLTRDGVFARGEPVWDLSEGSTILEDSSDALQGLEEKNLVVNGYGMDYTLSEQASGRCTTPHPLGTFCYVPHDKKVRFKYNGPNDTSQPYSYKASFNAAILNFCGDLNEAGFDCASTTGSSNEVVTIGPLPGTTIGEAIQADCGSHVGDIVVHPGQGPDKKCHACTITVDAAKIGIGRTPDKANIALQNTYYHEWAHCQALGHLNRSGYVMNPLLQSDTSILFMDTPDFERFQNYQP